MIRNIIFDFGGVIYDIDHNLSKLAFEKLGIDRFDEIYGHEIQTEIFEKLEKGQIEDRDFLQYLLKFLPAETSLQDIEDAWCALMIGFDKRKIDLLGELKKNYQLYLLSNSNSIHYKRFIETLNAYQDFRSLFDDVWFSFEKGMRKPDSKIFLELIKENQLNPAETLFIDDLATNINAAQGLNIKTHYLHQENILDIFENGLLKENI